jgi:hypothetical protein
MHSRRLASRAARPTLLACAVAALGFALPAQGYRFDELAGRGLPRELTDTSVVCLLDLDQDGHLDLLFGAVEVYPGLPIGVRLGGPDGVFRVAPNSYVPGTAVLPSTLLCADFDGDGDTDVFVVNRDYVQNHLFLNDGAGRLVDATPGRVPATLDDSRGGAVGDIDGDGDADLIVVNSLGQDYTLINDGSANFTVGTTLSDPLFDDPTGVALLNARGVGVLDAVVTDAGGQNRYWQNDGSGVFSEATAARLPADSDVSMAVAPFDADGDGDIDLLIGNRGAPDRLYRNDGNGVFGGNPSDMPAAAVETSALAVVDVDGDVDLDVVCARLGEPNAVLLNDSTGVFTAVQAPWPLVPDHSNCVTVGDVDSDGDADVVFGNGTSIDAPGHKHLYLNDGGGQFAWATALCWSAPDESSVAIATGDMTGDGLPDVVVIRDLSIEIWANNGFGGLLSAGTYASGSSPDFCRSLAVGDVDGDRDLDLVVGTVGPNLLFLNDGAGGLSPSLIPLPPATLDTESILLVDLDGDGDLDVLEGNAGSAAQFAQQNRILVNDGSGTFTDETATRLPAFADFTFGLATGDVDGDGDLDLLFANLNVVVPTAPRQPNRLLLNDGSGNFSDAPAGQLPIDNDPSVDAAFADIDLDGDLDLVVANQRQRNRLFRNDGTGTFTLDPTALPSAVRVTQAVEAIDFDRDGDVDVFFANSDSFNAVLVNDGTGFLTEYTDSAFGVFRDATVDLAFLDVDRDRDYDLVTANTNRQADRLQLCLSRQLDIPLPLRVGRSFSIEVFAADPTPATRALVWVAAAPSIPIPFEPIGTILIDVTTSAVVSETVVPGATGQVITTLPLPGNPALIGSRAYFQAYIYDFSALMESRLTNVLAPVIGS